MKSLIMGAISVLAIAQTSQAAICGATVQLNKRFSGVPHGTEIANAEKLMRQAGLAREGSVLKSLHVFVTGQPNQNAILAWKYSYDNNLMPAPGINFVPSGPALTVLPHAVEQIFDINSDKYLEPMKVTYRQFTALQPGESAARYYFINGAGSAQANRAYIIVQTPDARCR